MFFLVLFFHIFFEFVIYYMANTVRRSDLERLELPLKSYHHENSDLPAACESSDSESVAESVQKARRFDYEEATNSLDSPFRSNRSRTRAPSAEH